MINLPSFFQCSTGLEALLQFIEFGLLIALILLIGHQVQKAKENKEKKSK